MRLGQISAVGSLLVSAALAVAWLVPVTLPSTPASAFSSREISDAAYHWGRVDLAAERCVRLRVNDNIRQDVFNALARVGREAWDGGYALGRSDGTEYIEGYGEPAFCEVAWAFYGRNGQRVKNLLLRR